MTFQPLTSDVLESLAADIGEEGDIRLRDVLQLLGARAFGLAILLFSLPNSIPLPSPPGFSALTGFPIILLALQMMAGVSYPWLPRWIADRRIACAKFSHLILWSLPHIRRVERHLHPRLDFICTQNAMRITALVILVLSLILTLPIPFANYLPAFAISLIAIGYLGRDGALILAGFVFGIGGLSLVFAIFGGVITTFLTGFF